MNSQNKKINRLERLLTSAWRENEGKTPEGGWQKGVMNKIRALSEVESNETTIFNGLAWRISLVASAAALVLVVYSLYNGIMPETELTMLFVNDPGGFILSPPFG